jgi:chromosome segregation ATPase
LASLKGHEEELRKAAQGLKRALEESEQRLDEAEDEIIILNSELGNQKQECSQLNDELVGLKRSNDRKDADIEKLNLLRTEIIKKKTPTGTSQPDYETEVIELLCQNQQMEMRMADAVRERDEERKKTGRAEEFARELEEELRNHKEIMGILREEYEQELQDRAGSIKDKTPIDAPKPIRKNPPPKSVPNIITSLPEPVPNIITSVPEPKHELVTRSPPKSTIRGTIPL